MRDTIADLLTDPDSIVLRAEFEAEALRDKRIRQSFVDALRHQIRDGENSFGASYDLPKSVRA